MTIIIIIILILLILALSFWRSERKRGKHAFVEAVANEQSGKFEEACYSYAIAASAGVNSKICLGKIRELWQTHGPFDFSAQHDKVVSEYCYDNSCGEGYNRITIAYIRKIIEYKNPESAT
jgi:FtsZ-interacting cell division protein ZipA